MSELTAYMKALAKERRESNERYSDLEDRLIGYHQQYDELATSAGIDIGDDKWWDTSEAERHAMLLELIRGLSAKQNANEPPANQQQQPAMCLGCEYWRMPSGGHCMRGEGTNFCFKVGPYAGVR